MLKLEKNMIERIVKGKASIEFQVEAFKALGESLDKIEAAIKEGKKIATKIDIKIIESELNKEIKPVKTTTVVKAEEIKPEIKQKQKSESVATKKIEVKETKTEKVKKEIKTEVKKELNTEKVKEEIKTEAKRQISRNMMVKCGKNEGNDEVVYIEKIKDDIHTWRGQIRLQNVVYNFHWSNELSLPVVYNAPDLSYVLIANKMIKERVGVDECNKYDQLFTNVPELGNYGGRYYYDDLEKGSFIYMTPWFRVKKDEPEVWFKGYTMDHAFVVFSDKRIYYRNVNYLFVKRPWETTVSKGYDTKEVRRSACRLMKLIIEQFDNYVNNNDKNENKKMKGGDATITKTEPKTAVKNSINDISIAEIHGNNNKGNDNIEYVRKGHKLSIEDVDAGKRFEEDIEAKKATLDNMDVSALF